MRTVGTVAHRPLSPFFDGIIAKRFPIFMLVKDISTDSGLKPAECFANLAKPDGLGFAIQEPDHRVLPMEMSESVLPI